MKANSAAASVPSELVVGILLAVVGLALSLGKAHHCSATLVSPLWKTNACCVHLAASCSSSRFIISSDFCERYSLSSCWNWSVASDWRFK